MMGACGAVSDEKEPVPSNPPALQTASTGNVHRHYIISPQMGDTVTIDVWTPEGYDGSSRRYPVIYMHDGQNLFDATTTWNHQSWEMDSVIGTLIADGKISVPVIVGIHSVAESRKGDLMPENALKYLPEKRSEAVDEFLDTTSLRGNAYAAFIVNTLKPRMDALYRLSPERDSTFVMGSSMGGLMSIYALSEYPETFGAAGCLSTHWIGTLDGNNAFSDAMYAYLDEKLPRDGHHRLYLDHGTTTLDSLYGPSEERMIGLVRSHGYSEERGTLETFVDEGGAHQESSWAARVWRPLQFLLGEK